MMFCLSESTIFDDGEQETRMFFFLFQSSNIDVAVVENLLIKTCFGLFAITFEVFRKVFLSTYEITVTCL